MLVGSQQLYPEESHFHHYHVGGEVDVTDTDTSILTNMEEVCFCGTCGISGG